LISCCHAGYFSKKYPGFKKRQQNAQQLVHPSGVLQLSIVLLCGAQQDINIQLDNNNGRFLNPAAYFL
jgi:hypothetical protein